MYLSLDELMGRKSVMLISRLFRLSYLGRVRRRTRLRGVRRYVIFD